MSNKAMKLRHWERITKITGHHFDLEDNQLALKDIMEAPLMQVRKATNRIKEKKLDLLFSSKRTSRTCASPP